MTADLGRLAVDLTKRDGSVMIATADGKALAAVYDVGMRGRRRQDAERMVLCWNACMGMTDDELRAKAGPAPMVAATGKKK